MAVKTYQELKIWKNSYDLALTIYGATSLFPKDELFGLTSQLRRAAVSVPLNISEGAGRGRSGDFVRFLYIARGSAQEVICAIMFARDMGYVSEKQANDLIDRYSGISAGIYACIKSLTSDK